MSGRVGIHYHRRPMGISVYYGTGYSNTYTSAKAGPNGQKELTHGAKAKDHARLGRR